MSGPDVTAGHPARAAPPHAAHRRAPRHAVSLTHAAALYRDDADLGRVGALAGRAIEAGAALHVAAPDQTMRVIWNSSGSTQENSRFVEMTELGRNPARIIAAGQSFGEEHPGKHICCVWEPAWPLRSAAELAEVARHEALCSLAFGAKPMTIVCLYDTGQLSDEVISNAELTHPFIISGGRQRASREYLGAGRFPPGCDEPLPAPSADAASIRFDNELRAVREFSASQGRAAGLDRARIRDVVIAVNEIAANALGHAHGRGVIRSWCTRDEILFQVEDGGHITDPLAGRRRRPADAAGGHGLWLVNLLCDLVEQRTGPGGTITRLHMRFAARA